MNVTDNTVLIVDEVDDLIVDKAPNDYYGMKHTGKSKQLLSCFAAIDKNQPMPTGSRRQHLTLTQAPNT